MFNILAIIAAIARADEESTRKIARASTRRFLEALTVADDCTFV